MDKEQWRRTGKVTNILLIILAIVFVPYYIGRLYVFLGGPIATSTDYWPVGLSLSVMAIVVYAICSGIYTYIKRGF